MPRQNRRRSDREVAPPDRAPITSMGERREQWRGRDFSVRSVTGVQSARSYRCPGCDQEIHGGPHVVAWPADDLGADDRRHWHTVCWNARENRAPGTLRGRSAPRY